jgi:hypothetical protein
VPLNAPPYDPTQWGWGPQDRFYVQRSYFGFAKDYPGTYPYRMVPPNATTYPVCAGPGPMGVPYGPPAVVAPIGPMPAPVVGMNGPSMVAF